MTVRLAAGRLVAALPLVILSLMGLLACAENKAVQQSEEPAANNELVEQDSAQADAVEPDQALESPEAPETPAPSTERPAYQLVGSPAPDFQLELLDGGKVDLASHKGKDVVILDFWATWCDPCRRAMPTIAEVARQYKDKGVVFYAVNIGEDAETIRQALSADQLEITVAMDVEGQVGELYKANAIPQTVLIGKDGTVEVVHIGASEDLKERLSTELDALVAGKTLAGEG